MSLTESAAVVDPRHNIDAVEKSRKYVALGISAIVLLLAAFTRWPYFFYILLRTLVCAVSADWSRRAYIEERTAWAWIFGGTAVLYNPLLPVHMHRSDWELINLVTAVFFLVWIAISRLQERHSKKPGFVTLPAVAEPYDMPRKLAAHDISVEQEAENWFQTGRRFYDSVDAGDWNPEKAVECFEGGLRIMPTHRNLRVYLGMMYLDGDGVPQDYAKAFEHLSVPAEMGDSEAQRVLGAMCEHGHGVSQDREIAAHWYEKAAKQGDSFAENRLEFLRREQVQG